jgi:hypothetical protein
LSQAKEEKNFQPAKEKPMPHNRSKQFRTLMAFFLGLMIVAILAVGILGIAWAQHLEGQDAHDIMNRYRTRRKICSGYCNSL